ncbi:MAG: hypothetical protein A2046_03830 [Bacteroidetes bacterium GWA2_30_7]|nr:MAG: hypothetical protein A2046_03830 [Bacteroidetes bacterium GWA2_30_7]
MKRIINNFIYFLFIIEFALLVNSCKNDNEEDLKICDTTNVSYSSIKTIFDNNCVRCHNDQINNNDILLNTYENAKTAAESGLLYKAVNHLSGATPMPYQLPKLENCEVRKISIWIETNTPE